MVMWNFQVNLWTTFSCWMLSKANFSKWFGFWWFYHFVIKLLYIFKLFVLCFSLSWKYKETQIRFLKSSKFLGELILETESLLSNMGRPLNCFFLFVLCWRSCTLMFTFFHFGYLAMCSCYKYGMRIYL